MQVVGPMELLNIIPMNIAVGIEEEMRLMSISLQEVVDMVEVEEPAEELLIKGRMFLMKFKQTIPPRHSQQLPSRVGIHPDLERWYRSLKL